MAPEASEPSDTEHRAGLRRLGVHVAVVAVVFASSYVVPALARVRPWVAGEGVPVVRLFASGTRQELPEFQNARAVAAPAQRSPARAPTGGPLAAGGVRVDPSEYDGLVVGIEQPQALAAFYAALRETAQAAPGAVTRVAHYGDSAIAADEITFTLRRMLQARFGDAGHGFMLVARGQMHYLHRDIVHRESDGWEPLTLVRKPLRDGHYGYGGVQARAAGGEHASFGTVKDAQVGTKVSRFELYYQRFPGGGDVRLAVDGVPRPVVHTRADAMEDAFERIDVPDGEHQLSIRTVGAQVRLYGVVLERDVPGVVYDSLGLVGARAERLLDLDGVHIARQLEHRRPDLLVLGFGGNEAGNAWLDPERYARDLAKVVRHLRAGHPALSCLLFAPLDQGERNERGDVVQLPVLSSVVAAQRSVARREGCAFFDTVAAMGGPGSVARWYKQRPRLISADFRHATPAGYERIATLYYKALLKGFADYLASR